MGVLLRRISLRRSRGEERREVNSMDAEGEEDGEEVSGEGGVEAVVGGGEEISGEEELRSRV